MGGGCVFNLNVKYIHVYFFSLSFFLFLREGGGDPKVGDMVISQIYLNCKIIMTTCMV